MLLSKGFEVEMYTSTPTGKVVGLSDKISADLRNFAKEPDSRNVEYITEPFTQYNHLFHALLEPRQRLRLYLQKLGNYTIMPGSTLALGGTDEFHRSQPNNPYHTYIEQTYGTDVVTASIHINIGIPDIEKLLQAYRLIRMEAPLYLALSASSPFLNGETTGFHSTRWHMFPKTPANVPLFANHQHFIDWTNTQLEQGTMQNVRHLWSSVRPNGNNRPYQLNRLELRIIDLVSNPHHLLAITALLEMRLQLMLLENQLCSKCDPIAVGASPFTPDELIQIADQNETAVARDSLDATLIHWQTGEYIQARDWIAQQYDQVKVIAKQMEVFDFLFPIQEILSSGNEAQRWLAEYTKGLSPHQIMTNAIQAAELQERELLEGLAVECPR